MSLAVLLGLGLLTAALVGFAAGAQPKAQGAADKAESASSTDEGDQELEQALEEAEAAGPASGEGKTGGAEVQAVPAAATHAVVQTAPLPGLRLMRKARLGSDGAFTAAVAEGKPVRLTLHGRLQAEMQKMLALYRPEGAAIVALEPATGRVLALVEYSADGKSEGFATRPLYPAASIFKIITGAALLEHGVSPEAETCYHGGMHGIGAKLLKDKPRLDRRCLSLSMALAKSANVVFAKMAVKHLDADSLRSEAEKFLFNRPIWTEPQVEKSTAAIPEQGLEFAKSAAGFGDVKLSPLHAALIAAAVGNGGVAADPTLLEPAPGAPAATGTLRLLEPETARALTEMMKLTVSQGTARHSFRERRRRWLGDIEVAGKTGSLAKHKRPYRDYSWFVGFAPADAPQIAISVVVVNGLRWKIHAPTVAREALRIYLMGEHPQRPPVARSRTARHRKHK
jgi:peptidoglycan glycosyltransferase